MTVTVTLARAILMTVTDSDASARAAVIDSDLKRRFARSGILRKMPDPSLAKRDHDIWDAVPGP